MLVHCQLLFTTVLYFTVFVGSIVALSTLSAAKSYVGGCYLFVTFKNKGAIDVRPNLPCSFNVYAYGAAAVYSLIMTIYHGYGVLVALRESHIGRTMWVMPWLLLNSLTGILIFICSCIYSVGFYLTCSRASAALSYDGKSCIKNLENISWGKGVSFQDKSFSCMSATEITSWVCVLLWGALFALQMIRLFRNRRARAKDAFADPTTSDDVKIGDLPPSA